MIREVSHVCSFQDRASSLTAKFPQYCPVRSLIARFPQYCLQLGFYCMIKIIDSVPKDKYIDESVLVSATRQTDKCIDVENA